MSIVLGYFVGFFVGVLTLGAVAILNMASGTAILLSVVCSALGLLVVVAIEKLFDRD